MLEIKVPRLPMKVRFATARAGDEGITLKEWRPILISEDRYLNQLAKAYL